MVKVPGALDLHRELRAAHVPFEVLHDEAIQLLLLFRVEVVQGAVVRNDLVEQVDLAAGVDTAIVLFILLRGAVYDDAILVSTRTTVRLNLLLFALAPSSLSHLKSCGIW